MGKEFIVAKEYIHETSIGKEPEIDLIIAKVVGHLRERRKMNKIEGFSVLFINRKEKAKKKLIFSDYERITEGVYPFLYTAIQFFDKEGDVECKQFLSDNGFVQIE